MKKYEIALDEITAKFFEEIALIVQRPVEEILSDALFKQTEIICRRAAEPSADDEGQT